MVHHPSLSPCTNSPAKFVHDDQVIVFVQDAIAKTAHLLVLLFFIWKLFELNIGDVV